MLKAAGKGLAFAAMALAVSAAQTGEGKLHWNLRLNETRGPIRAADMSAPSGNAPVLGSAPKGTRFTATGQEGDWVQVENTGMKGWISSQFLAPNKPQ